MNQSPDIARSNLDFKAFSDRAVVLSDPVTSQQQQEQQDRLFRLARWLGECAARVYPPSEDKEEKKRLTKKRNDLLTRWDSTPWQGFFAKMDQKNDEKKDDSGSLDDTQVLDIAKDTLPTQWTEEFIEPAEHDSSERENDIDFIATRMHNRYRAAVRRRWFYPWNVVCWKWWPKLNKAIDDAQGQYRVAHDIWVDQARRRIESWVKQSWPGPNDKAGDVEVEFHSKHGTEYFIARYGNVKVLSFRGTQPNKLRDIVTDLLAWQVEDPKTKVKLHAGFSEALDGIWEDLETEFTGDNPAPSAEETASTNTSETTAQPIVWITGHSLGGALATLAAYRLVSEDILNADQIGGVMTFGQPRVGDRKFRSTYRGLKGHREGYLNDRHYRFVNNCDRVTRVPPKSLWPLSIMAGLIFPKLFAADSPKKGTGTSSGKKTWTFEYGDVGRVVFVNRAFGLKLLTPDSALGFKFWKLAFWWPVLLWLSRRGSWFGALFTSKKSGALQRFLPGITDHSMDEYNQALNTK